MDDRTCRHDSTIEPTGTAISTAAASNGLANSATPVIILEVPDHSGIAGLEGIFNDRSLGAASFSFVCRMRSAKSGR
jgi:hypothetical protein